MIPQRRPKCSVLMCVYKGDNADYFADALRSIVEQTVKPDDIVIVVDGPIGERLQKALRQAQKDYANLNIVELLQNVGVGQANNEGLKHCKNQLVAKMDPDDIAVKNRLELQLAKFQKSPRLVLLGGQIAEFKDSPDHIISYRKVPTSEEAIKKYARQRTPFNNQTVMFKKTVVQEIGGYPKLNRGEDYLLYGKIIASGYKVANLPQTLVYYRIDDQAYARRKTWRHTKESIGVRNQIRKMGLSNIWDFLFTSTGQLVVFIMPRFVTKLIYGALRK